MNLQLFGFTDLDQLHLWKEPAIATADLVAASSASAVASVGVPTKAEFDAVVLLLNELKVKYALNVTITNALKAKLNVICKG